tara:strand:- start:534 stop:746 length:213 start_codon:yes stop_codon:yes gene_type:complete
MFNIYELKVNFNDTSKKDLAISWERLCLVADINIPNPNTYQLLDAKKTLAKTFEVDIDDVVVYANEMPIL